MFIACYSGGSGAADCENSATPLATGYAAFIRSYCEWCLQAIRNPPAARTVAERRKLDQFLDLYHKAEIYFAYDRIHNVVNMPFRTESPRVVFNTARFLFMRVSSKSPPPGILVSHIVYVLAQEAASQEAWKLARFAYLRLNSLKARWPRNLLP
jgi:hypothetical protein